MEQNFAKMFDDVRQERSLILSSSLTDPDIIRQKEFTDYEFDIKKNIA